MRHSHAGSNPAAGAYNLRFEVSGFQRSVFSYRYGKMLDNFMEGLSQKDRELVYNFLEIECNKKGLTEERRLKHITALRKLFSIFKNKDIRKTTQKDVDIVFCWIRNYQKWDLMTKRDHWFMVKRFLKYINPKLDFSEYKLARSRNKRRVLRTCYKILVWRCQMANEENARWKRKICQEHIK